MEITSSSGSAGVPPHPSKSLFRTRGSWRGARSPRGEAGPDPRPLGRATGFNNVPGLPSLKMAPDRGLPLCPAGSLRHTSPRSALSQHGACPPNFRHCPHQIWRLSFSFHCARLVRSPGVASAASPPSTQRWRKRLRPFEFQRSRQSRAQRSRSSGRRRDPRAGAAMDSLPGEDPTLPVAFEGR